MKTKIIVGILIVVFFAFMSSLMISGMLSRSAIPEPKQTSSEVTEARVLSAEIVAEHNTQSDCWSIIDEYVYDITSYISFHPGGIDTIIQSCGIDASILFHTKGGQGSDHLPSTSTLLKTYVIGKLGDEVQVAVTTSNTNAAGTGGPLIPPSQDQNLNSNNGNSGNSFTLNSETVAKHNSVSDCYIIVNNTVYNITSYIPFHPGGTSIIAGYCGKEATNAFNTKGGNGGSHSSSANSLLANYRIGNLNENIAPADATVAVANPTTVIVPLPTTATGSTTTGVSLTSAEVAKHSSQSDCWFIYGGSVYNVTAYIPFHPGGTSRIVNTCGGDATVAFDTRGGSGTHSTSAKNTLQNYLLGSLGSTSTTSTGISGSSDTSTGTSSYSTPEAAIQAAYPGATITKIEYEDDGRKTVKFTWNGNSYEAKLDAANNITKVDD